MADFGFVGSAYEAPSRYQDDQELINWFCEVDSLKPDASYVAELGRQDTRGVIALYPTPGYTLAYTLPTGPVRQMLTLPGGLKHLVVSGSILYSVSSTYAITALGTLNTATGPVSMVQNSLAAYLVDGTNRYSYLYSTGAFQVLPPTDGPFLGGQSVDFVDGTFIYMQPGTQNWAESNLVNGITDPTGITTPALALAKKGSAGDNLVALIVVARSVYLLGEQTSEVWINTGASTQFSFSIIPGSNTQHGCAAYASVSRLGESFAFVSQDTRGQAIVVHAQGYSMVRMSTHAVENDIKGGVISDAIAWTYQLEGHEFYVLNFPTQDKTWVYDLATGYWFKWLSVDSYNVYHRQRGQCTCLFQEQNLIGDYQNGKVYALSNQVYTENGATIRRLRRAPHLVQDLQRVFYEELQIQFEPGVGLPTGQGQNPQAMLRWSNDGGSTWSSEHWTSIGVIGAYKNRAIWRNMGESRDRVYEVVVTDPIKAVIISANLKATAGEN